MPSKTAQLIALYSVFVISGGLHYIVYRNFRRVLIRDYPKLGKRFVLLTRVLFLVMDSPFLFILFRGHLHASLTETSRVLLYPFSVWQAVMMMWVMILVVQWALRGVGMGA